VTTKSVKTVKPQKTPAPEPAAVPLLDLPRLLVAIRRKRRMWLSLAVLGLIAGGLVAVFLPPAPSAVTELLVVHENDAASDSGNLMQTDVAVLQTTKIAGDALKRLGSTESPETFLKTYEGTGLTSNMMRLEVTGKTGSDAVRRAKALADAFIADHVSRTQEAAAADAQALIDQRDRTQAELTKVNNQINSAQKKANKDTNGDGQPDGNVSTTESESLYARRAELTAKVSDLTNRAETAGIGAPRVAAGTQIVDAPRAVPNSLIVTGGTNAAIGFGLMLAAGIAIAAIGGVVRDRPVLRRDIAENLGASVIAQLSAPRRGPSRLWRAKRAVRERRRVAGTLVRLVRSGAGPVSVLELGAPRVAAALALDVASELTTDRDVVIIEDPAGRVVDDDLPGRDLDELTGRAHRPIRIIGAEETAPRPAGETRLGIGSVTPGTSWTDLRHLGVETLLVVRTGFADMAWLHTVARQLADCQIPIVGVVLVDPDPRDKSDGTLWDGLHTALRGHGLGPAAIEARVAPPEVDEAPAPVSVPQLPAAASAELPIPAAAQVPAAASAEHPAPAARWETPTRPPTQPVHANMSANGPVAAYGPRPVEQPTPTRIERPAAAPFARPIAAVQPQSGPARPDQPASDGPTRPIAQPESANGTEPVEQPTVSNAAAPSNANGVAEQPSAFARPGAAGPNGVAEKPEPAPGREKEPATESESATEAESAAQAGAGHAAQAMPAEAAQAAPVEVAEQTEMEPAEVAAPAEAAQAGAVEAAAHADAEQATPAAAAEQATAEQGAPATAAGHGQANGEQAGQAEQAEVTPAKSDDEDHKRDEERKPHPERKPSWVPEPVVKSEARPEPKPHPERRPSWVPEPVAKPTPAGPAEQPVGHAVGHPAGASAEGDKTEHDDRTPMPVHYPAPVPANGVNGRTPNADLPTKRFAPVQPHLKNGKSDDVHDLPTKRFAPVRPEHGPKS
jgi:capsular polysaccharide biosynthesis protein